MHHSPVGMLQGVKGGKNKGDSMPATFQLISLLEGVAHFPPLLLLPLYEPHLSVSDISVSDFGSGVWDVLL